MKRTDTITKLVALLLFLALAAYFGLSLYDRVNNTVVTAELGMAEAAESVQAQGLIVREEMLIFSALGNTVSTVADGQHVAAGSAVARSYGSERALELASRIDELEVQLALARTQRQIVGMGPAERTAARQEAVTELCRCLYGTAGGDRDSAAAQLEALLDNSGGTSLTDAEIAGLEQELMSLRAASDNATTAVTTERAGVFTSYTDGWESVTPAQLNDVSVSELEDLIAGSRPVSSTCAGKLVTDHNWYYAAILEREDAAHFTEGQDVVLDFGRYLDGHIDAAVYAVGRPEGDRVVVTFRSDTALTDTLALRSVKAEIIFARYEGLYVPQDALHHDAEGDFLYAVTGIQAERADVSIVYEGDGYCLVRGGTLREGREIIVRGRNLEPGSVIG